MRLFVMAALVCGVMAACDGGTKEKPMMTDTEVSEKAPKEVSRVVYYTISDA